MDFLNHSIQLKLMGKRIPGKTIFGIEMRDVASIFCVVGSSNGILKV